MSRSDPIPPLSVEIPYVGALPLLRSLRGLPGTVFLDSGQEPEELGRYSFLTADPFLLLLNKREITESTFRNRRSRSRENPFFLLGETLHRFQMAHDPELPPFQGGAVGYFGYELAHHCRDQFWIGSPTSRNRSPSAVGCVKVLPYPVERDDVNLPDLRMGLYSWVVALDHSREKSWIVATGLPESDPVKRTKNARSLLGRIRRRIDGTLTGKKSIRESGILEDPRRNSYEAGPLSSNFTKSAYLKAIRKVQEYIREGDVYQVNLAQRFGGPFSGSTLSLYLTLREINPAPFAAYLDCGNFRIVSSSPERFLRLRGNRVETRPIKGTRPRSADPAEDRRLASELAASVKDRAENLMIVDLLRNDLSKVCRKNSVRVPALFSLVEYPTVFHLVSTIEGTLRPGTSAVDLMEASFPGGSITGAPKLRAMEIITELERRNRGVYCGSIAYLSFSGHMDSSIVIRTILQKGNRCFFHVGGGITSDSDPEEEYQETLDKGKALFQALRRKVPGAR
jgi:para-aminobenzoate synthetase component 1